MITRHMMCHDASHNSRARDQRPISIACWNTRGVTTSYAYLHKLKRNDDIICLSEYCLHANRLHLLSKISDDFLYIAHVSNLLSKNLR